MARWVAAGYCSCIWDCAERLLCCGKSCVQLASGNWITSQKGTSTREIVLALPPTLRVNCATLEKVPHPAINQQLRILSCKKMT